MVGNRFLDPVSTWRNSSSSWIRLKIASFSSHPGHDRALVWACATTSGSHFCLAL